MGLQLARFFSFPPDQIPAGYTIEAIAATTIRRTNRSTSAAPHRMWVDNTEDEMFFVFVDYVPYEEGDENISLETPLLSGIGALDPEGPLVSLQPNPSRGQVQILADPSFIGRNWSVVDLGGRLLLEGTFRSANQRFDLTGLQNGVYLFQSEDGVERMVIQR